MPSAHIHQIQSTPIAYYAGYRQALRDSFRKGIPRPVEYRQRQLAQLAYMLQDNHARFTDALYQDLGKPALEVYLAEIGAALNGALKAAREVANWATPQDVQTDDMWKPFGPKIYKAAKGVVLIIGPSNYPCILTLQPLTGAIASGCCAVVKPSELTPTYANLLAELLPQYLDSSCYRIVNGSIPETTALLELKWDHIFYTGSAVVAKVIATAAAKHLTPCSLELGGKCAAVIDPNVPADDEDYVLRAAKRILWGKTQHAGQVCVSADYVLVKESMVDEVVEAFRTVSKQFYPDGALAKDASYSSILNRAHLARHEKLLADTKGKIVIGGQVDETRLKLEPTVVVLEDRQDVLMQTEIFGPILPIVPVQDIDDAIEFINDMPEALALYVFSADQAVKSRFINETLSGSIVFNDTYQQLGVTNLPFGCVGASGYGYQGGKFTYDGFTHLRSSIDVPKEAEPHISIRYPPYSEQATNIFFGAVKQPIPFERIPPITTNGVETNGKKVETSGNGRATVLAA
ncbi:aldehyde dehydrogenase family [Rhizoctonia solani]|uniref:Aldehyde dehydrogenase n=1 Tax=Rhizoctonia solani TaxID=456999 RepID=A0A8H7H8H9_9AGAM|nr:aldehyde dehydrogenase family [Rhizoctonia solani]